MRLLPKKSLVAFVTLCAIGSAACVKQDAPGVGLVKFDSSAVFGITPPDKPVVPDFSVPEIEDLQLPDVVTPPRRFDTSVPDGPCPAAKLTDFPKKSASVRVDGMPTMGIYKWKRNLLTVKNATVTPPVLKALPFALENRALRRVVQETDHQFSFDMLSTDPFQAGNTIITSFRVNTNDELLVDRTVAASTIGVVNVPGTDVRVFNPADAPGIFITAIDVQDESGARLSSFRPVQPMLVAPLEGGILRSGQTFRSVGIDATTGAVLLNDGVVGRTSRVDACGEIVEGYVVTLHQVLTSDLTLNEGENIVDLNQLAATAARQETREVTYTFATQYGAMPIGESISIGDMEIDAVAASAKWELGGLTPAPLPDSVK